MTVNPEDKYIQFIKVHNFREKTLQAQCDYIQNSALTRNEKSDQINDLVTSSYIFEEKQANFNGFTSSYLPQIHAEPFMAYLNTFNPYCLEAVSLALEENAIKRVIVNDQIMYDFVGINQSTVHYFFKEGFEKGEINWDFIKRFVLANGRECKTLGNNNAPKTQKSKEYNSRFYK